MMVQHDVHDGARWTSSIFLNEQLVCVTHIKCTTGVYIVWFSYHCLHRISKSETRVVKKKKKKRPTSLETALKREIYAIYDFQIISSHFIDVSDNWWTLLYQSVKPTISGIWLSGPIMRLSASSSIIWVKRSRILRVSFAPVPKQNLSMKKKPQQ